MASPDQDLTERFVNFYREYYRHEVGKLAQRYPRDQRSLEIDYNDLFMFDRGIADDYLEKPEQMREYAEEALYQFDLPADVDLTGGNDYPAAHVRVSGLNQEETYYPGEYSPKHDAGEFIAVEGQVHKATDQYATIIEAAFECQRCGTMSYIPQDDDGFQEPHECSGCERQGPFNVDHNQSVFVDSQKIRVQEPPERTANGTGDYLDVYVEDDLVYEVEPGDKVVVAGTLNLEQKGSKQKKENVFIPYLDGHAITLRDTEFEEIELDEEDVAESEALVDGTSEPTTSSTTTGIRVCSRRSPATRETTSTTWPSSRWRRRFSATTFGNCPTRYSLSAVFASRISMGRSNVATSTSSISATRRRQRVRCWTQSRRSPRAR